MGFKFIPRKFTGIYFTCTINRFVTPLTYSGSLLPKGRLLLPKFFLVVLSLSKKIPYIYNARHLILSVPNQIIIYFRIIYFLKLSRRINVLKSSRATMKKEEISENISTSTRLTDKDFSIISNN